MAFPQSALPVTVELLLNGTWTDITTYVYNRDQIRITRGRTAESQNVDPSTCALTLDNRDGRFSPRNPTGAYYGNIGRNTQLRVKVSTLDNTTLQTTSPTSSNASTPTNAALNTAADVDLRVDLVPFDWFTRAQDIIGKWDPVTNQRGYLLWTDGVGNLWYSYSTTGTNQFDISSTVPLPRGNNQRFSVRVVHDVDAGATNNTVTFYYADSISGTWLQLGDIVNRAGTTSIFACTAALNIARVVSSGSQQSLIGKFYKAEVRTGVGAGTLAASPDFTAQSAGTTSFADAQTRTWTVSATASISSNSIRFWGEVSQWPVKWDPSQSDIYVPIVASGILRRLQANTPPLKSVLRRSIPALSTLKGYWPMEDDSTASSLAYGLTDLLGQYSMTITNGPSLSSYTSFLASDSIPSFTNQSYARGRIPAYTASGFAQLRFLLSTPSSSPPSDGSVMAKLTCSNTSWQLQYKTGGAMQVVCVDNTGATVYSSGSLATGLDGKNWMISLELTQNGANIDWKLQQLQIGAATGFFFSASVATQTLGVAIAIQVGCTGSSSSVAIGHVTIESTITSLFALNTQLNAYQGELDLTRALRLGTEEGYTIYKYGVTDTAMGAQLIMSFIDLLHQCADSNQGILYEPRGVFALVLKPRTWMVANGPSLTVDYSLAHLVGFEPVEDDQNVLNDIILQRINGSFVEASLTSGTLSTNAPPNGIGKYQSSVSVSLYTDSQLRDQAYYRLARGTVDEPRYPSIGISLHRSQFSSSKSLMRQALDIDIGDIIEVDNPPSFYAPFTVYQRIEGVTETITQFTYDIDYNTSPGTIWRNGGIWNDPTNRSRYDSDASTVNAGITSVATSMAVAISDGNLWTTTDTPFQVSVGGEVMNVTAVSGSSSPQTFTVTRSVNGVVKAQTLGTSVHVYTPSYYGF